MKKLIIFLILTCTILLNVEINVHAEEKQFYESDYLNIYLKRHHSSNINMPFYQTARIYRDKNTNEEVYCIQPEIGMNENAIYQKFNPSYLTTDQKEMIKLLSYYGYKYPGHNTDVWYMVTQLLIWKTVDPNGLYYFTDTLNGIETYKYNNEIIELYSLISDYLTVPNITIPNIIKSNTKLEITDPNNILNKYKTNLGKIENNTLVLENLEPGEHTIYLSRNYEKTNKDFGFYTSSNSQDMYVRGDITDTVITFNIKVINPSIKIIKTDKDQKVYENTSLEGTEFKLTNLETKKEHTLVIDKNKTSYIDNLELGNYLLKEIKSGIGYKINNNEYNISLTEENPNIELTIDNEVIKKEIIIHKTYGEHDFKNEPNIIFNIYNQKNELINVIKTDETGTTKIVLPYGKYTIVQVNTTDGFQKVEPMNIEVIDENLLFIELKDYKISVPDTYQKASLFSIILKMLFNI